MSGQDGRDWLRSAGSAEARAALGFTLCVLASGGFAASYWLAMDPQVLGTTFGVALLGLGYGLVTWGRELLKSGPYYEHRDPLPEPRPARHAFVADLHRGDAGRRRFLLGALGAAVGAFGLAALFPVRSLGPRPASALRVTPWRAGRLVVDLHGQPVRAEEVAVGGFLTVFPEGHTGSPDGQAVLVRVDPELYQPSPDREGWSPLGLLCFSKVCTHAGCPVGLYQADTQQLMCPCHQSAFDVLKGATPVFGPAAAPLPQLPLDITPDGLLVATGDFSAPIGPAFWSRP